ncbi:MAG: 7-carboxy-7-deazaguanine synthase QueE [Campylobacterales bacterium]
MKLKISNIFYSIQGEGRFIGTPSIFIRFFDCNLSCDFCDDTSHKQSYDEYSFEELLSAFNGFKSKFITITGGEPTLYELNPLIEFLQTKGYFVSVETNGMNLQNIKKANWITYSPKKWSSIESSGYSEVKFIVESSSDVDKILELKTDKQIYIQPKNDMDSSDSKNMKFCIELVKKQPRLKLSPQLHKLLDIE